MKQKSPKSTLLSDNTQGLITTKQKKPRPVAYEAPHCDYITMNISFPSTPHFPHINVSFPPPSLNIWDKPFPSPPPLFFPGYEPGNERDRRIQFRNGYLRFLVRYVLPHDHESAIWARTVGGYDIIYYLFSLGNLRANRSRLIPVTVYHIAPGHCIQRTMWRWPQTSVYRSCNYIYIKTRYIYIYIYILSYLYRCAFINNIEQYKYLYDMLCNYKISPTFGLKGMYLIHSYPPHHFKGLCRRPSKVNCRQRPPHLVGRDSFCSKKDWIYDKSSIYFDSLRSFFTDWSPW